MNDSLLKRFNGTRINGKAQDGTESLFDTLDPAHANLLGWTETVLTYELNGKGWAAAAAKVWADEAHSPVEQTLNREPEPSLMKSAQFSFPLLWLYPRESSSNQWTLELSRVTTLWRFGYCLGPLTPVGYEAIGAALRAFPKVIEMMFKARYHAQHDGGADQFDVDEVDFATIRLVRSVYGAASFGDQGDGSPFYVAEAEVETTEVEGWEDDWAPDFTGFDINARVDGITDFVTAEVTL